ncbi:glycosyltransferase family 2 protein [Candidatus Venteria ishoeyi]|uniref:SPBc2 prophage-derived glycosyltransferase SunS n=1 Tax=Candidatus Venteria ishoeyi TaxID=1899563 RepID=A0A1H6F934_9GAMM|nr:glycosyltransferase family 2 protein [Candidatus Venteria ishoeyi]MDM8548057.1 glycosyltransferase family 2 protein [Candidatus Venteria ishoeyi]SEH06620.1 SPBc2 prophage-derived glycosyltransferase SunS [Candidatus Venteria ishoeyi]
MIKLSVIIITFNEADNIRACLKSVAWADEIIVLDSGSHDNTIDICREFTSQVYVTDWPGFGLQKNRCLKKAQNEWVLSIDADERVTPELRAAITDAIQQSHYNAWRIPRKSWFCGKFMRYGGWYPDYVLRLFKRTTACFSNDLVHEQVIVKQGATGTLGHALVHYSYIDPDEVLSKLNHYSSAWAQNAWKHGKSASLTQALLHELWTFIRLYVFRLGFLDGTYGFIAARYHAQTTYYKYLKLSILYNTNNKRGSLS